MAESTRAGPTRLRPWQTARRLWLSLQNPLEALPSAAYRVPLLQTRLLHRHLVHVMDPALIQQALAGHAAALDKGETVRRPLTPALGEGLLTAEGAHWRWQRQALAPLFRPDRVQALLAPMLAAAEQARDRLATATQPVAIEQETIRTTFDIILATMLPGNIAIDAAEMAQGVNDYVRQTNWSLVLVMLGLPEWTPHPGRGRARRAVRRMRGQVSAHVAARRTGHGPARAEPDLLDQLLSAQDPETGRAMTDAEVTDNLLTFLTAGHETTALSLAWTLDLVARHPEVQARAAAEIRAVTGGAPVAARHIAGLDYLRCVIQEGMRLYPPVPMIARSVREAFALGGADVPAGATLVVPIAAVHRHTALWTDPDRFDPGRFTTEAAAGRHRYAFMPFGAGPRVCIGNGFAMLEATAILAVLLQALRFEPALPAPPAARMDLTLRPVAPLLLRVATAPSSSPDAPPASRSSCRHPRPAMSP